MKIYRYKAIFDYDKDGITVTFPDLPGCITCGNNEEEALKNAKECMALHLFGMEEDNDLIPEPTKIEALDKNQKVFDIEILMSDYEKLIDRL